MPLKRADLEHLSALTNSSIGVSAEFMFQPACLRFNGNPMRMVGVEGAIVRTEPSEQVQEVDRLEGGETVVPVALETNEQGEWLKNEQGWVNSKIFAIRLKMN